MTDQPKNAKDMTDAQFATAKREVSLNARRSAREPKSTSFSRFDRNLQETLGFLGDISAHDMKPGEYAETKSKLSRLASVTEQRARQARTISRIKARQGARGKS